MPIFNPAGDNLARMLASKQQPVYTPGAPAPKIAPPPVTSVGGDTALPPLPPIQSTGAGALGELLGRYLNRDNIRAEQQRQMEAEAAKAEEAKAAARVWGDPVMDAYGQGRLSQTNEQTGAVKFLTEAAKAEAAKAPAMSLYEKTLGELTSAGVPPEQAQQIAKAHVMKQYQPEAAPAPDAPAAAGFKDVQALRKEFAMESKNFKTQQDGFRNILTLAEKAAKGDSAYSDHALVFAYMKVLDPTSTVREGEFATAAANAGASDRIVALIQRAETGEILSPNQRADLVRTAQQMYKASYDNQQRLRGQYESIAKSSQMDPAQALIGYSDPELYGHEFAPGENLGVAGALAKAGGSIADQIGQIDAELEEINRQLGQTSQRPASQMSEEELRRIAGQ